MEAKVNLQMSHGARVTLKKQLNARVEQFHGTHDEKSHGSWADDFQPGDIIEYKERGAMLGQISETKSSKGRKYVKVMWEDGSVFDVEKDQIKVVKDKRKDEFSYHGN